MTTADMTTAGPPAPEDTARQHLPGSSRGRHRQGSNATQAGNPAQDNNPPPDSSGRQGIRRSRYPGGRSGGPGNSSRRNRPSGNSVDSTPTLKRRTPARSTPVRHTPARLTEPPPPDSPAM